MPAVYPQFPISRGADLIRTLLALLLCLAFAVPLSADATGQEDAVFADAVDALKARKFRDKRKAVGELAKMKDARVIPILEAMLEGQLYYRKSDKRVVSAQEAGDDYAITDVLSLESLGTVSKRKLKKIGVNNRLRGTLRASIARLSLTHEDPAVRVAAVEQIAKAVTPQTGPLLRNALKTEKDVDVREAMRVTLALVDLESEDKTERLKAIEVLRGALSSAARNRLATFAARNADGSYAEPEADVRKAAAEALESIQAKLEIYGFLETAFFGLSLGSVLVLAAIGLAITFGVMGVINMAHGELIMLGAYTTYLVQSALPNHGELSLLLAIPAAFVVSGLFGIAIERGVIRFLYGRPLETLLATFGISLILQQLVRTAISAQNVTVFNPDWMSGSLQINPVLSITYNRLYILAFALMVFAALVLLLKKTSLGLQVRAVAQNRGMARAMGIRSRWVDAMTFGLGSGIAGVAGVALSQLTNVGPNMGQSYIIDSFMVVVFGGVGNLWGTLVGGLTLGVANKFLEPHAGAVLAKILVLVFIILFIQKRPRGLFPQKGRAAEA